MVRFMRPLQAWVNSFFEEKDDFDRGEESEPREKRVSDQKAQSRLHRQTPTFHGATGYSKQLKYDDTYRGVDQFNDGYTVEVST